MTEKVEKNGPRSRWDEVELETVAAPSGRRFFPGLGEGSNSGDEVGCESMVVALADVPKQLGGGGKKNLEEGKKTTWRRGKKQLGGGEKSQQKMPKEERRTNENSLMPSESQ